MAQFTRTVVTAFPFTEAVDSTREALEEAGLAVVEESDVNVAAWNNLGVDGQEYHRFTVSTLGLAEAVAGPAPTAGVLPVTVAVFRDAERDVVMVSAVDAVELLTLDEDHDLGEVAEDVAERLARALDAVGDAPEARLNEGTGPPGPGEEWPRGSTGGAPARGGD